MGCAVMFWKQQSIPYYYFIPYCNLFVNMSNSSTDYRSVIVASLWVAFLVQSDADESKAC